MKEQWDSIINGELLSGGRALDVIHEIHRHYDVFKHHLHYMEGDERIEDLPFLSPSIRDAASVYRVVQANTSLPDDKKNRYVSLIDGTVVDAFDTDLVQRILNTEIKQPVNTKLLGRVQNQGISVMASHVANTIFHSTAHLMENPTSGQPGFAAFEVACNHLMAEQGRNEDLGMLALDINNLKWINDKIGHMAGDTYISVAGRIIQEVAAQHGAIAYHKSGDEFYIPAESNETGLRELNLIALKIQKRMDEVLLEYTDESTGITHNIPMSCSAGVSLGPSAKSAIRNSESMMMEPPGLIAFGSAQTARKITNDLVASGVIERAPLTKKEYKNYGYRGLRAEKKPPFGYSNSRDMVEPVTHGQSSGVFGGMIEDRKTIQSTRPEQLAGRLDQVLPPDQQERYMDIVKSHIFEEMDDLSINPTLYGIHRSDSMESIFRKMLTDDSGLADYQRLRERIKEKMMTNPLSKIPNKKAYEKDLREAEKPGSNFKPTEYVVADLNGLKDLNDEYGHAAGDAMLIAMAQAAQRAAGNVSRAGGGEVRAYHPHGDEVYVLAESSVSADLFIEHYRRLLNEASFSFEDEKGREVTIKGLTAGMGSGQTFSEADSNANLNKESIKAQDGYTNGIHELTIKDPSPSSEVEAAFQARKLSREHGRTGHGMA